MIRPWLTTLALRMLDEQEERTEEEREAERRALEALSDEELSTRARGAPIRVDDFVARLEGGPAEYGTPLVEQRAANEDAGAPPNSTLFVASTNTPDRALDVIEQDWSQGGLREWRSNPVIFDNHSPFRVVGQGIPDTGRSQAGWVPKDGADAGKLMIRVGWNVDSPDPSIAAVGFDHLRGFRRAGSVGFVSKEKTPRDKLPTDHYAYAEPIEVEAWWGGKIKIAGTYFRRNALREFSSTSIPMNPEALQRSLLDEYQGIDPADVARRASARFPRDLARALVDQLKTDNRPETRGALLEILWPDVVAKMRTDPEVRRICSAFVHAVPPAPPVPVPTIAELTLRLLQE